MILIRKVVISVLFLLMLSSTPASGGVVHANSSGDNLYALSSSPRAASFTLSITPSAKKMEFEGVSSSWPSFLFVMGSSPCRQSPDVRVSGSVVDANDRSPITDAAISIQAQIWFMEISGRYPPVSYANTTATTYSNATGQYQTTLQFPYHHACRDSTALCTGTEYFSFVSMKMVAEKAGYDPASVADMPNWRTITLPFPPSHLIVASPSKLTIAQGQSGSLNVTIDESSMSIDEFEHSVNWTALHVPAGVSVQFNLSSVLSNETGPLSIHTVTPVTVSVSNGAPIGNYTLGIQMFSGNAVCVQLTITPAGIRPIGPKKMSLRVNVSEVMIYSYVISGQVIDLDSNQPVEGALVSVQIRTMYGTSYGPTNYSNKDGVFRLSGSLPFLPKPLVQIPCCGCGQEYNISADKPGYETAQYSLFFPPMNCPTMTVWWLVIIGLIAYVAIRLQMKKHSDSRYRRGPHDAATNKGQALIDR